MFLKSALLTFLVGSILSFGDCDRQSSHLRSSNAAGASRHLETAYSDWIPLGEELFGLPPLDSSTLVGFGDTIAVSQSDDGSRFMAVGAPHSDYNHGSNTTLPFHNPQGGLVRLFAMANGESTWKLIWAFAGDIDEKIGFGLDLVNLSPTLNRIAIRRSDKIIIKDVDIEGHCTTPGDTPLTTPGKLVKMNADGTVMAVSSETLNGQKGRVEVFHSLEAGGLLEWKLIVTFDGEESWDRLGYSLAIDSTGTRIALGIPYKNEETGDVRVFDYDGSEWTQAGADISGKSLGGLFGWSLDMSADGKTIVAGATGSYTDGGSATDARGSILIYKEIDNAWQQVGSDLEGEFTKENFGRAVTMDRTGNRVAASSFKYNNHKGRVKVFNYNSETIGSWDMITEFRGKAFHERMGRGLSSLAMSNDGSVLAVGSPLEEVGTNRTGKVQVLEEQDITSKPSSIPSAMPSFEPSSNPSFQPSILLSNTPSRDPSISPTSHPSQTPSLLFTFEPSRNSTGSSHVISSMEPSPLPSTSSTHTPSKMPSSSPLLGPSEFPSGATSSIPTLELSFMPSASFTETPSKMPTLESSAKPSQPPSGSPSTLPTFEVSGVPSDVPSEHISVSPNIGYSVEPSQAPSRVHGQSQEPSGMVDTNGGNTDNSPNIGTDIFERANATIDFGDGSRDKEISLFFNISTRETRVTVFEKDCRSLVDTNIVEVMKDFTPRSETHGDLDIIVDIKQDPVMSSAIWLWDEEETHLAHIDICIRVEVLVENIDGSTFGRNFFDSELAIEIDMSVGFSSASISPARRNYGTENRSVSGDFSVESCQCNEDWQCISETIFQGDKLRVCLLSNSSQTMFHSLDSFQLSQALESGNGFLVDLIVDSGKERNELTHVAYDGNRLMVTTEAANFFFTNQDTGIVTASGVVTIGFGSTGRRSMLRTTIDKRDLMDEGNTLFNQDIPIGLGPSSSAMLFDTGLLTALALAIGTSVFVL